ncbi:hypothetical protein KQI84_01700 [bacterium]|nr:hypothetical protein [bacterium]
MNQRPRVKRGLAVFGVLFFCLLLFHGGTVWGTQVFCGGDIVNNEFPRRAYWLAQGFSTGWFSSTMSGFPYFGDIQAGVLYPPKWLFWLGLPLERAMTWVLLLHLLGGGLGFYRLARLRVSLIPALLAGILWMCGGYLMLRLVSGIAIFIYSLAWFPWMWAEAELCGQANKRATARLALLGALQFLAGAPQLVQITWMGLGIWVLGRAIAEPGTAKTRLLTVVHFGIAGLVTLIISLPQLAASWVYAQLGVGRGAEQAWNYLTSDSLSPRTLITDLAPDFFMTGTNEMFYWGSSTGFHETNAYVGIAALMLAALGLVVGWKRLGGTDLSLEQSADRRWLATGLVLAVFGLLVALGRNTFVYKVLYSILPGFDLFRVPARWQLWTVGPIILFAAFGLERLLQMSDEDAPDEERKRLAIAGASIAVVFAIGFAVARGIVPSLAEVLGLSDRLPGLPPGLKEDILTTASNSLEWGLSMVVVTAIAGGLLIARKLNRRVAIGLLFAGVLLDLLRFWGPFSDPIPQVLDRMEIESEAVYHKIAAADFQDFFYPETPLVDELRASPEGRFVYTNSMLDYRVDEYTREIACERPAVYGLETMRGYQPLLLKSYVEDFRHLYDASRLNVPPDSELSAFMFLPQVDDRTYLDAYNATVLLTYGIFPDGEPAREKLERIGLQFKKQMPYGLQIWENPHAVGWAWLSSDDQWPGIENRAAVEIAELERTPDRTAFRVVVPDEGMTVHFAEIEYPNWRIVATGPDGQTVEGEGRSMALPAGEWQVERTYHLPAMSRTMLPVSALLFLGLLVGGFWPVRKRKEVAE